MAISFEEYSKRRKAGESQEQIVASLSSTPSQSSQQKAGRMSFEEYAQARRAGYSQDDIIKMIQPAKSTARRTTSELSSRRETVAKDDTPSAVYARNYSRAQATRERDSARDRLRDLKDERAQLSGYITDDLSAAMYADRIAELDRQIAEAKKSHKASKEEYDKVFSDYNAARDELKAADRALRIAETDTTNPNYAENVKAAETRLANAREAYVAQGGDPDANVISAGLRGSASGVVDTFGYLQELAQPENEKSWGPFTTGHMTEEDKHRKQVLEERRKAKYEAEHGAGSYEYKPDYQRTQEIAGRLAEQSASEIESMKTGKSELGQFAVDLGVQGVQMGADVAAGQILPGGALTAMALRSFGGGVNEAREAGATLGQQGLYGLGTAAVEVVTEIMFDGLAKIYGGGIADDMVSHAIGKYAKSNVGRAALNFIADAAGEGLEEVISDIANPILKTIYNDKTIRESFRDNWDWSDVLYDFLVGASMGAVGGGVSVIKNATGSNTDARTEFFMQAGQDGKSLKQAVNEWKLLQIDSGYSMQTESNEIKDLAEEYRKRIEQGKRVSERKIEQLNQRAVDQITTEDIANTVTAVQTRMQELGQNDPKLAQAIAAVALESEAERVGARNMAATPEQHRLVQGNQTAQRILSEMDVENLRNEQTAESINEIAALGGASAEEMQKLIAPYQRSNEWVKTMPKNKVLAADVYGQKSEKVSVSNSEKNGVTLNGQAVKIVGAQKDGKVVVEQQNGERQTVELEALQGLSEGYSQLIAAAAETDSAEAMLRLYQGGQDVARFAKAWDYAENVYGAETKATFEQVRESPLVDELDDIQLKYALENGRKRAEQKAAEIKAKSEKFKAAREEARQKEGVQQRKKGTVRIDKSVEGMKLTRQQKSTIAMVKAMADAVNLHYEIYAGKADEGGSYISGGTIRININSGILTGKHIGAATLSHEITHFLREFAPEEYQDLKDFITAEVIKKSPSEFDRLVQIQMRLEPELTKADAVDEVIANACQKMLLSDRVIGKLARQNMTLCEKIADRIEEFTEKIKAAYEEVDLSDDMAVYHAARAILDFNEEVSERFARALEAATENYNAAQATYWKNQTRQTKERTVRQQDTDRLANDLLREFESRADKDEVKAGIKELGDWLVQTRDLDYDELRSRAEAIAEEIVDGNYTMIDDSNAENLSRLKDFLKSTALNLSAEDFRVTGDEGFRKKYGRYFTVRQNGRTIDSAWGELAAMFGEGLFPADTYAPGDMLSMIGDYLDLWKPQYGNAFELFRGEAVEAATNEIVDRMLSEEVRQTAATYADKAQQKLNAQIARDREKLDALREQKNARIEEIKRQAAEKNKQIRIAEKAAKYEAVDKVKRHYQDMMQLQRVTRNETAGQRKYRVQVAEKAAALEKMLRTNSDKLHVPEALKAPLAGFLSSIDFSSKSMLRNGTETQADRKFQSSLAALSDILSRQERNLNGDENADNGLDGYLDMSQESMEYLREMTEEIHRMMNTGETFTVNDMTAEQLQGLSKLLSNITASIRNMNSFLANERYKSVQEAADADIRYMESLGSASNFERSGLMSAAAWKNGTPYYILKRFGEGGKAIFDSFTKGWEKMAENVEEIMAFTEKTYTDKEVKAWKSELHSIELSDGSKIQMTTAQIMAFSVLIGREQAMKHIEKGGIRIGDIKQKVGKRVDTKHYHLTAEDMSTIIGKLTDRQAEVAKKLQHYMALKGAAWGNEISMRRFGYAFYDEGDVYFPIRTDSNDRGMQDTDAVQNSMFRLLNLSSSKSLNPKASNALIVEDIFDVFADHMSDMAKLNGMGLPILDAIKWFNYKERIELGDGEYDTRTLMGAMDQAFGDQAQRYFRTLMKDINGVSEAGDRGTDLLAKLMGNYKAASVGANLRVALLQPTSYVRASAIIDPKYLLQAFTSRNAYKEALANSGTAKWKAMGYYDTNISRSMREQIKHDATLKEKIVEKSMTLAELGDKLTWGRLWVACKMQTKAQNRSLTGQELINKTADLFRETIYATQVMDSTLTRSELMRGKSLSDKAMTSFMAEPTLSYNMVMDAVSDIRLDKRQNGKGAFWRNKEKFARMVSVYAASAAFAAVVESLMDAIRDDDDEEFWEKYLDALFGEKDPDTEIRKIMSGNLAQDLTILGKLPYLKSFISTLQGYKSKDMSVAAFNSIIEAAAIWQETIQLATGQLDKPTKVTYNGNMTTWGKISKTLQALSQITGVSTSNMTRDVTALWNTIIGEEHPELKVKTYRSKGEKMDIYFKALESGDKKTAERFKADYADKNAEKTALTGQIHDLYTAGEATDAQTIDRLQKYGGMTRREAEDKTQKWKMEVETGMKFIDLQDAYISGEVSRNDAVKYFKTYNSFGHTTLEEAQEKVLEWTCEKDTGIAYSDIGTEVKTGRLGKERAVRMLVNYGGKSEDAADKTVEGWLIEHEYNIKPTELEEEYLAGNVDVGTAYDILMRYQYNGKEDANEKAADTLEKWNFVAENPGTEDMNITQIHRYQNSGLEGVVSGKDFLDAYEATNIMHGVDTDGDGKANRYTRVDQQLEYIDAMALTADHKTALALALGINEKSIRNRAPWSIWRRKK